MCKGRCRRSPEGTADPIEAGNLLTWVWGVNSGLLEGQHPVLSTVPTLQPFCECILCSVDLKMKQKMFQMSLEKERTS